TDLFAEIAGILQTVTGEGKEWAARITPNSALEQDLGLESLELVEVGERLRDRYGEETDLLSYVAELDIDELIGLTMADLVAYVASRVAGS
ncbi:MAG TPA: phosphopantetheine-binding protein, partial [Pseudonocardiaceae bacterium]|nr:phosphopantetheine-binding protein [Pseudonocardiaceae bacterium]